MASATLFPNKYAPCSAVGAYIEGVQGIVGFCPWTVRLLSVNCSQREPKQAKGRRELALILLAVVCLLRRALE